MISQAPRRFIATLLTVMLGSVALVGSASPAVAAVDDGTRFFVPPANPGALQQISELKNQRRKADASRIQTLVDTPTAVWLTAGSAHQAEEKVREVTQRAVAERTVPVLVLYNIPFRDCDQYSAGGATSVDDYRAWVDAVVRGIGDRNAVVAVEPDSLGIVPWYTDREGDLGWCRPSAIDPDTAANERFAMLNYAVQKLAELPSTSVYLDGTHNGWLSVGEISERLLEAGVQHADGFFVNASHFQWTRNLEQYGTWISSCLAYVTQVRTGDFAGCGHQYWSGGPANKWDGVTLDPAKIWSDSTTEPTANTAGINSRYAGILGDVRPTKTFLIDTSRNGRGPWTPTGSQAAWPDPQTWCNPPERGLGFRPSTTTANRLADAYVWLKVPGESDGQCSRGRGTGDQVVDPVWDRVDPAAGRWFAEQANQLTRLANPALRI